MIEQSNPTKNISRYDSDEKRMHGWQAQVRWDGERRYKRFSDNQYGGPEAALEAAIEWRDEQEQEMGKPRTEQWIRAYGTQPQSGKKWRRDSHE